MSPSEFFFLAAGLVLGVLSGAVLVEVLRARPAARREVRVTFAPAAVPARATTLAFAGGPGELAPDDDLFAPERLPPGADPERTFEIDRPARPPVGIPILADVEPVLAGREGPGTATARPDDDPCAAARAEMEERCGLAARMTTLAEAVNERLREARRAYDGHAARRASAAEVVDPRAVRAAKDEAQAAFRRARLAARDVRAQEAAASEWLREINRINLRTRTAAAIVTREDALEMELLRALERVGLEADGARITAENAANACRAARIAFADCEEAQREGPVEPPSEVAPGAGPVQPRRLEPSEEGAEAEAGALAGSAAAGHEPAILRLLRGDRATLRSVVERLAGPDVEAQRRWQLQVTDLVDAILARAIAASALTFPDGHPFWGPYTQAQGREIAAAMASLGFRFDGLGGFADGRIPSQRDLSLAIGYAGLDPMRIRRWPTEADMPDVFRDVRVDAGRFLAEAAGGLTMGEMVDLLGRRAEPLADLWNAWGRVRPVLLDIA